MSLGPRAAVLCLLLVAAASGSLAVQEESGGARSSLRTVEGTVLALRERPAEGDLPVVAATLQLAETDRGAAEPIEILLAPDAVLTETGFEIAEGDRLRARIFAGGDGPAKVQKVRNLSRSTMLRFRTLHQIPIWDSHGQWQGGPGPMHRGARQGRHGGPPR